MNIRFGKTWSHHGGKGNVSRKTVSIFAGRGNRACEVGFIDGSKWPDEPWEFEINTNLYGILADNIHTMTDAKARARQLFSEIDS